MGRFDSQVALVTGGARGIGGATARLLAAEGAQVVVADVLDDDGRALAAEIGAEYVHLDVSDPAGWAAVAASRPFTLGVLNAGIGARFEDVTALSDDLLAQVLGVNVSGVVLGTRELARSMAGRGGALSVTASIAGLVAHVQSPLYGASKWAVLGWVRSIAPALSADGIRINAVCPGLVDTPVLGPGGGQRMREMGFDVLDPSEVAEAHAESLLSGATGSVWTVQVGRGMTLVDQAPVPGYQG